MVVIQKPSWLRGLHVYKIQVSEGDILYLTLCRWWSRTHQNVEQDHLKYSVQVKDTSDRVVGHIAMEHSFEIGSRIEMGYIVSMEITGEPFWQVTAEWERKGRVVDCMLSYAEVV